MNAMVLAAGLGERFLPLTLTLAKPAIPVLGRPLALLVVSRMREAGAARSVVNLHHRPASLREALDEAGEDTRRTLHFLEEPRLLGTGGGMRNAASLLRGDGPILVHNADALSDVPLADVLAAHRRKGHRATMVLAPHRPGYTVVRADENDRIVAIGADGCAQNDRSFLFTGIHVVDEELLDRIPEDRPSDIVRDVYLGLMREGTLGAWIHDGFWWEFGTPEKYLEGSLHLLAMPAETRGRIAQTDPVRTFGYADAAVGPGVDLHSGGVTIRGRAAIGMAVLVGEGAEIEDSVVLPGAWIGPGCRLRRVIVGPGSEIAAGLDLDSLLVCSDPDPKTAPPSGCERFGGLLARRLG
jgi:NDP-sugar pyrophosphorylase family protein